MQQGKDKPKDTLALAVSTKRASLLVKGKNMNVFARVPVQALLEAPLINKVADKADGPAQDKESIERSIFNVHVGFLPRKSAAAPQQVDKAARDAPIDVEDQIGLFPRRDGLDLERIVEQRRGLELALRKRLDDFDAHVRVFEGFDFVPDSWNQHLHPAHLGDKLFG